MAHADDPVAHYDKIIRAWQHVLGEDFHYGYFRAPGEALDAATANLTALMAEHAALGPGLSVLDVGCGIGNPACLLAERYGCRVTGITTSREGVALATERAARRGYAGKLTFRVADGMANGLPDASFDRVWVMESSHLMPRKDALLAECARVMRPGAVLVLCDVMLRRELPLSEVLSRAREFVPLHYAFGRAKMETLATYGRLAAEAGLEVMQTVDLSEQTYATFEHWRQRLAANAQAVRAEVGDEGFGHLQASCDVLEGLWREPLLGYGLIAARRPEG